MRWLLILTAAALGVCDSGDGGDGDGSADGDSDVDMDVDADGDVDSDVDGDGDADGDADSDVDGDGDADGDADSDGPPMPVDECEEPGADWIFCSAFEEGSKEIWDDYDENPDSTNLLMEHPGPFDLSGNHVMRLRVPPGRGTADLVKVLPSEHDRLYARAGAQAVSGEPRALGGSRREVECEVG